MKLFTTTFATIAFLTSTAQSCDPNAVRGLTETMRSTFLSWQQGESVSSIDNEGFYKFTSPLSISVAPFLSEGPIGFLPASQGTNNTPPRNEKTDGRASHIQAYTVTFKAGGNYVCEELEYDSWTPYIPKTVDGFKDCFRTFHTTYNNFHCEAGYHWWKLADALVYLRATDMTREASQECKLLFDLALKGKTRLTEDKEKKYKPLMVVTRFTKKNGCQFITVKFVSYGDLFDTLHHPWASQKESCGINLYLGQLAPKPGAPVNVDY